MPSNPFLDQVPAREFSLTSYYLQSKLNDNKTNTGSLLISASNDPSTSNELIFTKANGDTTTLIITNVPTSSKAETANSVPTYEEAWTEYTVEWTSTSSPQPLLRSGFLEGYYKQIGKIVFVRVRLIFGADTSGGNGDWYFSLPVSASEASGIQFPCSILDDGRAWYQATVNGQYGGFTNKSAIICQSSGGINSSQGVTSIFPITWGNLDSLQFNGTYEAL